MATTKTRGETPVQLPVQRETEDEFIWLEDAQSRAALDWVDRQNDQTLGSFDPDALSRSTARIREVLDSTDKIPWVSKAGPYLYNFWKDADHSRGLWRRTTLESYRTDDPAWDVLLDIDDLCRLENAEWVFRGAYLLFPDYQRALIKLSPDGGDAVVVREFDLDARSFVMDGFNLPSAKTSVSWLDRDTLLISTDFGPGTLTTSGYPRQARRWRRGQPFAEAEQIFEVPTDHVGASAYRDRSGAFNRVIVHDSIDFHHSSTYMLKDDTLLPIDVPADAGVDFFHEWLLIYLRSPWTVGEAMYPAGALLAAIADEYLTGARHLHTLFVPDAKSSFMGYSPTLNHLLMSVLHDVATRVIVMTPGSAGWTSQELGNTEACQSISASGVDDDESDDFWLVTEGYLKPSTLQLGSVGSNTVETIKASPSFFDSDGLHVEQHFATSADGTRIPYFQIGPKDPTPEGTAPTLLCGYGGFEISELPGYSGSIGREWLTQGGVYVVANIRGGGEYGPAWHQAALRENRCRAYEDFAAVAQDLMKRGVISPSQLGCMGGSNGGLLVGNMLTRYPELFGAIVCDVPLLDMQRYTRILAGKSWIAEYGDPENPEDWAFLQGYSPYHNLRRDTSFPPVLFSTATSDDRVGPAHARKMAARMQSLCIPEVLFYENREGGHGGASDNDQKARMWALKYEFLRIRLFGSPADTND